MLKYLAFMVLGCTGLSTDGAGTDAATDAPAGEAGAGDETPDAQSELPPPDVPSVLFVLVDTLRADRLSLYGAERQTSPNLDAWAADAAVFERYTAQAGWTIPSVASLLSGLYPPAHGCCARDGGASGVGYEPMVDGLELLTEQLDAAGYDTAMLSKSGIIQEGLGFERGFDHFERVPGANTNDDAYQTDASGVSAGELTDSALDWLNDWSREAPFFLFLHYMEPHTDYEAPTPWLGMWADGYDSDLDGTQGTLSDLNDGRHRPSGDDAARLLALYDEEIAYLDSELQRIWDWMAEEEMGEHVYVVFVSDHGEMFGEHGNWGHNDLYQENIHVPLLVRGPGVPPGRYEQLVQAIDVAPTLTSLVGVDPASSWQGRDLTPLFDGDEIDPTYTLSVYGTASALISPKGRKLIKSGRTTEVYDLNTDPSETDDVSRTEPDETEDLEGVLKEMSGESEALYKELTR